jgi:serine/threonine protein kinase
MVAAAFEMPHNLDWEVNPKDVRMLRQLGVGSFSEVFAAIWLGAVVAVKRLRVRSSIGNDLLQSFKAEVDVLRSISTFF